MYEKFTWKILAILFVVALCATFLGFFDIKRGMDLKGGTELLYQIDVSRLDENQRRSIQDQAKEVLERRLNIIGLQDIKIRENGRFGVSIQIPSTMDKGKVRRLVERSGALMFKLIHSRYEKAPLTSPGYMESLNAKDREWISERIAEIKHQKEKGTYNEDQNPLDTGTYIYWSKDKDGKLITKAGKKVKSAETVLLLDNSPQNRVSGNLLRNAYPSTDNWGKRAVGFEFGSQGASIFGKITGNNIGKNLAIVLDGEIRSFPTIQSRIDGQGVITGEFSEDEIHELVVILKAGALPARLILPPSELTTGPGLGKESIQTGWMASILGFLLVCLFMIIYYRLCGVIANIALFFNLVIIMAVLALYHAFLTLPGIAGIVLTVGMSVDANILIFERIREELARGKTLRHAVNIGYDKAFWAIFDSNLTTLITAIILFVIGTGPIKGFAVTLSVGILSSMFTALFVTRVIFGILVAKKWISQINMMRLMDNPTIPFLKYRFLCIAISLLLIIAGMSNLIFMVGSDILGIDFTGGTLIQVKFKEPLTIDNIKAKLALVKDYEDAEIQAVEHGRVAGREGSREYQIRIRSFVKVKEPLLHYQKDPNYARIAFVYHIERDPQKRIFALKLKSDLRQLGVPLDDLRIITSMDNEAKKVWEVEDLNSLYWTVALLTAPQKISSEEFDLKALQNKIDEHLESKYKVVREEAQGKLISLFKEELAPVGFITPEENFIPSKDKKGIGQLRFWVNLETEGLTEKKIKDALLSVDFQRALQQKKLSFFEEKQVKVSLRKNGNYSPFIKGYEILAGPVAEKDESLYLASLREFFQAREDFVVSESFPRISQIGSAVAKNLTAKAFWAILFSLLAVLAYITIRFELTFAIGAVVALSHDLFMTLGIISFVDWIGVLDIKINLPLIAAFLTILGYSLNDTIVVFDRIRENILQRRRKEEYMDIVNSSLNQTLSRTVLTSMTTLIVVLILFLAGVKEIQGFSFALLCGVIVGTYSSLFIATPVVVFYHNRAQKFLEKRSQDASKKKKK